MRFPYSEIREPDAIDRLIALAATMNLVGRVELLRAVKDGIIALVELTREAALPSAALEKISRPTLLLVGDDDYASTGPGGWAAASRLHYWARGGMVHATGADVFSYRSVIFATLMARRYALVETDTAHAEVWGTYLSRRIPGIVVLTPADGAQHPLPLARSAVQ